MSLIRASVVALLVAVLGLGLVGATTPALVASTTTPPVGTVLFTGEWCGPDEITVAALAALPQQTVDVAFQAGGRPEQHTETGPLLSYVLPQGDIAVDPGRRNDILNFAVLAVGSDGYTATVSYADALADFGNRGLLISLVEDGRALERPRLIVPGDVRGGRYVSDLVELRVVRVGP